MPIQTVIISIDTYIKYADMEDSHDDLLVACNAMLKCTGGSENWNGCTYDALVLMEEAVKKAEGNE